MENPEALLDVLSMETFRQRFPGQGHSGQRFHAHNVFPLPAEEDQLEDMVRDLCIDDSISGCFMDSESEVKDTFDLKVWLPNPKQKDERPHGRTHDIDLATSVSHLPSSAISDDSLTSLHDVTESRRKGPVGSHNGDPDKKNPYKPVNADAENWLVETSPPASSFNLTNMTSKMPASKMHGGTTSGLGRRGNLPYGVYPDRPTGNKPETTYNQSILSPQRTCAIGQRSEELDKQRGGKFQSGCLDGIDAHSREPSISRVSTTFSQSLSTDTQPKIPVFQRMAFKPRMGKKRIQYQDQGRRSISDNKSYPVLKMSSDLSNESPSGFHQPEVTTTTRAQDQSVQSKMEKRNLRVSELTSDPQVSCGKEKDGVCSPEVEAFIENIDLINYENINSLALERGNPEPYFLPSFPTTSEDSTTTTDGILVSSSSDEIQANGQAVGKAAVPHHLQLGGILTYSFPNKSPDTKKGKQQRKPWYEVDDPRTSSEHSRHNKSQHVDLRAAIEESARVISPEPDTTSGEHSTIDDRPTLTNISKSKFPISGKAPDFRTVSFERKFDGHSPGGHRHRSNHRPLPAAGKLTFQGANKSQLSLGSERTSSYNVSPNIRADSQIYSTTDLNTSVSSSLNIITSTSVSTSTKTLPSVIPIITNNASSNESAISAAFSSKAEHSIPPLIKDLSLSPSSPPVIDTTATSVSSVVQVMSSSVPSRPNVSTISTTPSISSSVPFHNIVNPMPSPFSAVDATTTLLMSRIPSTTHVTLTSDSLDLNNVIPQTIPDDNHCQTSAVPSNNPTSTIQTVSTSANAIKEFNERLRGYINADEQDSLRNVLLNDPLIHANDWKYHQDKKLTPFHLAIQLGRMECLRILLGSQPLLDRYGWGEGLGLDLAKLAVRSNKVQSFLLLHRLLDTCQVKEPVDEDGNTFMHLAASLHHTDIILALLSLGHDVNIENKAGISPLKLCLHQHSAFPQNIVCDQNIGPKGGNRSRDGDLLGKSGQTPKAGDDSDSLEIADDLGENSLFLLQGEEPSSRHDTLPKSPSVASRTVVEIGGSTPPGTHGNADDPPCQTGNSSADEDTVKTGTDTVPGDGIGNGRFLSAGNLNADMPLDDKSNGQNRIVNLILTELMRSVSKLHENSQSCQDNSTPAIPEMEQVTAWLDQALYQTPTGQKTEEKTHAVTKGQNREYPESRSLTNDGLEGCVGASNPEANIPQLLLKYLKSLQESQQGVSQSNVDKDRLSLGQKVNSTQHLAAKGVVAEEKISMGNSGSIGSYCVQTVPLRVHEAQTVVTRKAAVQGDGDEHCVEKNKGNHQGLCGDRKSDISSSDSKSKEVDSFCISSDELYNSPPDRIPTVPTKSRSSRLPQSTRARPLDFSNGTSGDSRREIKAHVKPHERNKLHCLDTSRQDFKNHKSKSEISYILDSSSTSQDTREDQQMDYLNDDAMQSARRREARRRRWGGLSLLPHHLKKKIERLSQKGKRKTASGAISGSSNSSSSIVTSSSSSGGRGDQSAEGSSSVRAIVDFRDSGQDQHFVSPPQATRNRNTPMHVKSTRNAFSSASAWPQASHGKQNSHEAVGRVESKHDTQVTSYHYDKEQYSDSRESDPFWRSTDTFSSMTAVTEDSKIDFIRSISDVSLDASHDSISGFYDVSQRRSRRHHHHHHHHNHHHHHRSRSSDQSERDRFYHNHYSHHRRRRREALGCSPSRRRHRQPDNGSDENADIDEGDNDTDEEEESDVSDDPRVTVNVDNEEWPDEMLRVQRLAKHLESVQRLQNGNCQVIEMVVTGTGEVLTSQQDGPLDPNHVNIGEAYPFSSYDSKGKRMPLPTKRTTSPSGLGGRRAKIHLFNHEKLNADGNARTGQNEVAGFSHIESSAAERCLQMDQDVPWNLLTFSDSEDTDFGEMNSR